MGNRNGFRRLVALLAAGSAVTATVLFGSIGASAIVVDDSPASVGVSVVQTPLCSELPNASAEPPPDSSQSTADRIAWMSTPATQSLSDRLQPVLDASALVFGVTPDHGRQLPVIVIDRDASPTDVASLTASLNEAVDGTAQVEIRYGCHAMAYVRSVIDTVPDLIPADDDSNVLWGYRYDIGRIRVAIEKASTDARDALLDRFGPSVIVFEGGAPAPAAGSRGSDSSPHYGGAAIKNGEAHCTAGFTVNYGTTSKRAMVTAGHCAGAANAAVRSGNQKFGTMGPSNSIHLCTAAAYTCHDVAVIRSASEKYTNRIWTDEPIWKNSRQVTTARDQRWSDSICLSGQISGLQCGLTLTSSWKDNFKTGGSGAGEARYLDDVAVATSPSGKRVYEFGDSGAPVFVKVGYFSAKIVGMGIANQANAVGVIFHPQSIVKQRASELTGVNVTVATTAGSRTTY